jgi:glycosyltransferase involved in cell wall biosynthesis
VLDAAAQLTGEANVRFVLVGDGAEKQELVRQAAERGLHNVSFRDPVPKGDMPALVASSEVVLVPLKTYIPGAVPSKLYEAMASGRPVVLAAEGEGAEVVRRSGAGLVVPPGDPAALAAAVRALAADPALRRRMGEAGRRAAVERYDRARISGRFIDSLEESLPLRAPRRAPRPAAPASPAPVPAPGGNGAAAPALLLPADGAPVRPARRVSVVIPCRNEGRHIATCLDSVLANDWPRERLEVLVVDGMSDDGTRGVVAAYAVRHPVVRLLDNPRRITPAALNIGISAASGDLVVRMDAHNEYPPHYISRLVRWLEESGADNVGGLWETCPAADSAEARAIARALSHPFGVGNAHFRLGISAPRWVDTVPFGCYRREVFGRIGGFDEDLVRNQDDELNARLLRAGGRILLVHDVVSRYYPRESLAKLWRMYWQYGYFKPLAMRKVGAVPTMRQLVPAAFVLTLFAAALLALLVPPLRLGFAALVGGYLLADLAAAVHAGRHQGAAVVGWLALAFPVLHFSYGLGWLRGAVEFLLLRRARAAGALHLPPSR